MSIYRSPEDDNEGTLLCEQEQQSFKKEQTVEISISQYTDWMLKAHTLSEIKKIYNSVSDEETFYYAVGPLLE